LSNRDGIEARFNDRGDIQGPLGEAIVWLWRGGKAVPLTSESTAESQIKP
jgi:hypothetical protein